MEDVAVGARTRNAARLGRPLRPDGANAGRPRAGLGRGAAEGSPFRLQDVDDYFAEHCRDEYAGIRVTGPASVEVRLVRFSSVRRREVNERFPEVLITFAPAWHSTVAANELSTEIWAEWDAWNERGVDLMQSRVDADGLVVLGVRDPVSGEAAAPRSVRRHPCPRRARAGHRAALTSSPLRERIWRREGMGSKADP